MFGVIDRSGYDGYVGLEYKPRAGTVPGLTWGESAGRGIWMNAVIAPVVMGRQVLRRRPRAFLSRLPAGSRNACRKAQQERRLRASGVGRRNKSFGFR